MPSAFADDMTIAEAKGLLRELVDKGHPCPVCTQLAKVYRRKLNTSMAATLIRFYRAAGRDWGYLPEIAGEHRASADFGKLAAWALIAPRPGARDDGSTRTGWWRVTALGELWVRGDEGVPKYARIYNGRCLGLTGELVTVHDALGDRFDYGELMARGVPLVAQTR